MQRVRGKDANLKFLFGSVFFFFIIVVTIMLFGYFSLYESWNRQGMAAHEDYEISFSRQFDGLQFDVYINDSLVYSGAPVDADTVIRVSRFAEDNALLVVNKENDLVSIVELGKQGRVFVCFGKNGEVTADVTRR